MVSIKHIITLTKSLLKETSHKVLIFQVRFGAAPPPDCGDREEAFMLADKVLLQSVYLILSAISEQDSECSARKA